MSEGRQCQWGTRHPGSQRPNHAHRDLTPSGIARERVEPEERDSGHRLTCGERVVIEGTGADEETFGVDRGVVETLGR